ncbi:MAG: hypothetical protein ACI840_001574, partial [Ulvibacter sp.]
FYLSSLKILSILEKSVLFATNFDSNCFYLKDYYLHFLIK